MSFNYDNMPSTTAYTSIHIGKAPYFDGTYYNQWKHCMKNYLYSISPEVWQVVCDGVDFPDDDEQPTLDQLQKFIALLKQSPSSPHQLTRKNSTV
jgi:hypothetical protein